MILNAKDTLLTASPGTLPNMKEALLDYFQPLTFTVVTKQVIDFENVETKTKVKTQGVFQPLSAQAVQMKPEGQRAWDWRKIHAVPGLVLAVDSIIIRNGTYFRVMARWDYQEYGYVEYHVVNDYKSPTLLTENEDELVDEGGGEITT